MNSLCNCLIYQLDLYKYVRLSVMRVICPLKIHPVGWKRSVLQRADILYSHAGRFIWHLALNRLDVHAATLLTLLRPCVHAVSSELFCSNMVKRERAAQSLPRTYTVQQNRKNEPAVYLLWNVNSIFSRLQLKCCFQQEQSILRKTTIYDGDQSERFYYFYHPNNAADSPEVMFSFILIQDLLCITIVRCLVWPSRNQRVNPL